MKPRSYMISAVVVGAALGIATPLVIKHEGFQPVAYSDPVGIPTACYGTTKNVRLGQTFTKEECDILLNDELSAAIRVVDDATDAPLNDYQLAALGSFVYNVGPAAFRSSTLLRKLNAGDIAGACDQLPRWIYAKGRKLPGLVKRRQAERDLCLKGIKAI